MSERDRKGEERENETEPAEVTELMGKMEREISLLVGEMLEIMRRPTSRYELYPRIRSVIRLYWKVKSAISLTLVNGERQRQLERVLSELDKTPWKEEQMKNDTWKNQFAVLADGIKEEIKYSQSTLLPRLNERTSKCEWIRLGSIFKKAMKESVQPLQRERTAT